eukprot:1023237-Prorocentrum_minimum.AAC.2
MQAAAREAELVPDFKVEGGSGGGPEGANFKGSISLDAAERKRAAEESIRLQVRLRPLLITFYYS